MPGYIAFVRAISSAYVKPTYVHPEASYASDTISNAQITSYLGGILTAIFIALVECILPSWAPAVHLLLATGNRIYFGDKALRQHQSTSNLVVRGSFVAFQIFCSWLCLFYFPAPWRLAIYSGVFHILITIFVTTVEYAMVDGPSRRQMIYLRALFDMLSSFIITTLIIHRSELSTQIIWHFRFYTTLLGASIFLQRQSEVAIVIVLAIYCTTEAFWTFCRRLAVYVLLPGVGVGITAWRTSSTDAQWKKYVRSLAWVAYVLLRQSRFWRVAAVPDVLEGFQAWACGYLPDILQSVSLRLRKRLRTTELPQFEYAPLKKEHIRLLALEITFPGVVKARMIVCPLSACPAYEALSYRWGDRTPTEDIFIDGKRRSVPLFVYKVLLARSSVLRERIVWIDYLCINQEDLPEKGEQIQLMGSIFRNASRVILLPDLAWDSRCAVGLLYQHAFSKRGRQAQNQVTDFNTIMRFGLRTPAFRWKIMARLLHKEYFQRVWMVQEVTANDNVQVYLGGLYLPWHVLKEAMYAVATPAIMAIMSQQADSTFELHETAVNNIAMLHTLRREADSSPFWVTPSRSRQDLTKFETLLHFAVGFNASDDRDRVFALQGIATDMQEKGLPNSLLPRYDVPAAEIFRSVGRYYFLEVSPPSIHLLAHAGCGFESSQQLERTWIPQMWFKPHGTSLTDLQFSPHRFNASGKHVAEISAGPERDTLLMKGIVCDTIANFSADGEFRFFKDKRKGGQHLGNIVTKNLGAAIEFFNNGRGKDGQHPFAPNSRLEHALTADADLSITYKDVIQYQATAHFNAGKGRPKATGAEDKSGEDTFESYGNSATHNFFRHWIVACAGRRVARTAHGRLCLVPPFTREGDLVFVPCGAQTPFIIRRVIHGHRVMDLIVGEAYVQGIMQGEAFNDPGRSVFITVY